jgi:hypothetical protein
MPGMPQMVEVRGRCAAPGVRTDDEGRVKPLNAWREFNLKARDAAKRGDRICEAYWIGCMHTLELVYPKIFGRPQEAPEEKRCDDATQTTTAAR